MLVVAELLAAFPQAEALALVLAYAINRRR
jgi:hypothetical protein